jgi:hypothetical protein
VGESRVTETHDLVRAPGAAVAELLDRVSSEIRRYVVLRPEEVVAIVLWIFHTHAIDAAEATPYLSIKSALRESGKTRTLEVLELLVFRPLQTVNISDAALFRVIAEKQPTLLFDEVDTVFGAKARDREDLRGMLNGGYRRGACVYRMGGPRMTTLEPFPVFCAKALAGIGELPDTISSRSIPIRLRRRGPGETVERFRRRDVEPALELLRIELENTASMVIDRLRVATPGLPDELSDRAQDVWEPLLAIADLAGGGWEEVARNAAVKLSTRTEVDDETIAVRLLADVRMVFASDGGDRLSTKELLGLLAELEEAPWSSYGHSDKPLSPSQFARLLRPFEIRSRTIRFHDETTAKGFHLEQFEDAFSRYLPLETVTTSQPA